MQLPFITVVFEFEVAVSNKLLRTSTPKCGQCRPSVQTYSISPQCEDISILAQGDSGVSHRDCASRLDPGMNSCCRCGNADILFWTS